MNPKALYNLTYGMFLLTTREEGKDYGCIINTAVHNNIIKLIFIDCLTF